jgi:thymidylate synthase (FAD)
MARVSAPENQDKEASKLIRYLIEHNHWSPFEMVNAVFEIDTTRDIARQILRHRSFSFQEFSQRYATVDKLPRAEPREARLQDTKNRQNSIDVGTHNVLQGEWERRQRKIQDFADAEYNWAISNGLAKEVARSVLPEGLTTSRMYMNGTLRSWIHFCNLRSGNGTQKEHKEIAVTIRDILMSLYPNVWKALE